jgi:pimeloyl-ACP methyl ester carboxylesterase
MGSFQLPDDRRSDFLLQGAREGAPVILLHTLGYGAQLTARADREASDRGLSIIAPFRAGHGYSDPTSAIGPAALLEQSTEDLAALFDRLGITKARLIGHASGSTQAIHFAARYPERVEAVVMISRAPIWKDKWLLDLSPNHRALAILTRHLPGAARLIMGAVLRHFHQHGAFDYAAKGALHSPPDMAVLEDREVVNLMGHGVTFGLRQGPDAYCREFELMRLDLTKEARALPCPLTLIYGSADKIVPPIFAERFAEAVPQAHLVRVADGGHFLLYSHWHDVLDALMNPPSARLA